MFNFFRRNKQAQPVTVEETEKIEQALEPTRRTWFGRVSQLLKREEITPELWDELEEALISTDVGVQVTEELMARTQERVRQTGATSPGQVRTFLREEMMAVLSPALKDVEEPPEGTPWVILIVGVNGSGKTTTIAKLAKLYTDEGKRVMLVAGDTFRAAAIEQLQMWGERTGVEVMAGQPGGDPGAVVFDGLQSARTRRIDVVIIDTAGRLHTKTNLMEELRKVHRVIKRVEPTAPHEVLLVLDGTTGQNGLAQAQHFMDTVAVTDVVLTKLDGTAKGGTVLAVTGMLDLPIAYIGVGEKMTDLIPFDPGSFVDALLE